MIHGPGRGEGYNPNPVASFLPESRLNCRRQADLLTACRGESPHPSENTLTPKLAETSWVFTLLSAGACSLRSVAYQVEWAGNCRTKVLGILGTSEGLAFRRKDK